MSDRQALRQTRLELAPFFGNHPGAQIMIKLFIEPTGTFDASINESNPANLTAVPHALAAMKAESYTDKDPRMSNNDVHWQFTDFWIQTGLFHKEIDPATGTGAITTTDFGGLLRQVLNYLGQGANNDEIFGASSQTRRASGYTYYTTYGYAAAALNQAGADTNQFKKILTTIVGNTYGQQQYSGRPEYNVQRSIENIVRGSANNPGSGLLNQLLISPEISKRISDLQARLSPQQQGTFQDNVRRVLERNITDILNRYANQVRTRLPAGTAVGTAQALVSDIEADKLKDDLVKGLENSLNEVAGSGIAQVPGQGALAGPKAQQMTQAILGGWNNLSNEAKNFYKKYLDVLRYDSMSGLWNKVSLDQVGGVNPNDLANYRVNLTKIMMGREAPAFVRLIPKWSKGLLGNIWYTDASGQHVMLDTSRWQENDGATPGNGGANIFKNLYVAAYKGEASVDVEGASPVPISLPKAFSGQGGVVGFGTGASPSYAGPSAPYFSFNVDQFTRKRFFDIQKELKQPPVVKGPVLSMTDKNIWQVDQQGRLFMNENGNTIYYGANDPATVQRLRSQFKCYSTLVKADPTTCNKYVNQCLLSNDTDSLKVCAEIWKQKDFYDVSKEEIKNMHPLVAVRTLQKFGFRVHKVSDAMAGITIKKFEDVDHWIKHVLQKQPQFQTQIQSQTPGDNKTIQAIVESNENLLNYLRLIVEYVNANPAILNGKEMSVKTTEGVGRVEQSELARRYNIPMLKEPKGSGASFHDYSMLRSHMESGFTAQSRRRPGLSLSLGGPLYRSPITESSVGFSIPYQMGGASPDITSFLRKREGGMVTGADALGSMITGTILDLKTMNKEIDKEDITKITMKIDTMKKLEDELIKTEIYLEEYKYLMELFKNYKSEMLTMATIQQLVDKQKDLVSKQMDGETAMVKILGSLQGLLTGRCCEEFIECKDDYQPATVGFSDCPGPIQVPKVQPCI